MSEGAHVRGPSRPLHFDRGVIVLGTWRHAAAGRSREHAAQIDSATGGVAGLNHALLRRSPFATKQAMDLDILDLTLAHPALAQQTLSDKAEPR